MIDNQAFRCHANIDVNCGHGSGIAYCLRGCDDLKLAWVVFDQRGQVDGLALYSALIIPQPRPNPNQGSGFKLYSGV